MAAWRPPPGAGPFSGVDGAAERAQLSGGERGGEVGYYWSRRLSCRGRQLEEGLGRARGGTLTTRRSATAATARLIRSIPASAHSASLPWAQPEPPPALCEGPARVGVRRMGGEGLREEDN